MEKKINYLARSYNDIKSELIDLSKKYYPEISDNFNDASVGSWLIDIVSAVGDNLNYHADRMYQENNMNSASLKSSIMNNARNNNVKIVGPKSSLCEVELSCVLPINNSGNDGDTKSSTDVNNSLPDWRYAPIVKMGSTVGNSLYTYELIEDVDFSAQFNKDGISNRKFYPKRDANDNITGYVVSKTTIVTSGKSKIYKKVITKDEVRPFMEIILPEQNIMEIQSIIFKESASFSVDPQLCEFFSNGNDKNGVKTVRYYEVDSLSDQTIFADDNTMSKPPYIQDLDEQGRYYYKGKWKAVKNKFITEYTDNGYLKVIFGCGNDNSTKGKVLSDDVLDNASLYGKHVLSKIVNNDYLGTLPSAGWTMYVLYRVGGGTITNVAPGAINTVINANLRFNTNENVNDIKNSLNVTNLTPSMGGKDFQTMDEMKYYIKYNINSQDRCVTLKDYKSMIMSMPARYGNPFRCGVLEENNKIILSCLNVDSNNKLTQEINNVMSENMINYLSKKKTLGDYIEIRSGKIYNISLDVYVYIDKNYVSSDVVLTLINKIYDFMDIKNHDIGEDIFIGDLYRIISDVEGVISLIKVDVFSKTGVGYSNNVIKLPITDKGNNDLSEKLIDLEATDGVLINDYDSMFEIKDKNNDIRIKTKLR